MSILALIGDMVKVDSEGRVLIPKEVRDNLGLVPGVRVEIREEGGQIVIEPEDGPERILERMDELIEKAASNRQNGRPFGKHDPLSIDFRETVRGQAQKFDPEDEESERT